MENAALIDNTEKSRFELKIEGRLVFANYRFEGQTIYLPYVEAAPALRGTGAAGKLMQLITEYARAKKMKLQPICSYAVTWMNRHKEHHDLLI